MNIKMINPIKIIIDPLAKRKMDLYVKLSEDEVGWLGVAEKQADGDILIKDVFLPTQEVHATTCELTPDGINKLASELLGLPNGVELCNSLKVWGHSHVEMSTSPSGQDDAQLEEFAENNSWFLRLIANKKGDMRMTLLDLERGLVIDEIPWEVDLGYDLEEEISKELKDKVTKKSFVTTGTGTNVSELGGAEHWWDDCDYGYGYGYDYGNYNPSEEADDSKVIKFHKDFNKDDAVYLNCIDDVYTEVDMQLLWYFAEMLASGYTEDDVASEVVAALSDYQEFVGIGDDEVRLVLEAAKELYGLVDNSEDTENETTENGTTENGTTEKGGR